MPAAHTRKMFCADYWRKTHERKTNVTLIWALKYTRQVLASPAAVTYKGQDDATRKSQPRQLGRGYPKLNATHDGPVSYLAHVGCYLRLP